MASMSHVVPKATAIARVRGYIRTLTGHTIKDDTLIHGIIDFGSRGGTAVERRRLAMLGDMVLRTTILQNWYPTGRPVRKSTPLLL